MNAITGRNPYGGYQNPYMPSMNGYQAPAYGWPGYQQPGAQQQIMQQAQAPQMTKPTVHADIIQIENEAAGEKYPATYTTGGDSGRNQYSRENRNGYSGNNGGYSRNGYSRENRNGYSRTGDMTDQLRQMMDEAPDEMTRKEIEKLVDQMENRR